LCERAVFAALSLVLTAHSAVGGQQPSASLAPSDVYRSAVKRYCGGCHNDTLKTSGLSLDHVELTNVSADADIWERVIKKVRVGMMPPQGALQPDVATRDGLVSFLTHALDQAATTRPYPGRKLIHRLNRAEYANAVRDVLNLDVDPAGLLPPDDSAYGFDNVADVLGFSPLLMERYLSAAGKISALAVGDPQIGVASETIHVRQDASQDRHVEGQPIGTAGGMIARTTLPLDAEYDIQVKLFRTNLGAMRGLEYPNQLEITVDGSRVHLASFGGDADFKASLHNPTEAGDAVDARTHARVRLAAGPHLIGVAFIERAPAQGSLRLQPFLRSSHDTYDVTGYPHVDAFSITGPFNGTGPGDTPSRRAILVCRPARPSDEEPCGRRIASTLAHRAFRGSDDSEDVQRLMDFYREGRRQGNFDAGIQLVVQRILASPKFTLRIERDPSGASPSTPYRIDDLELASRLSFFLWSSIPDSELLQLAKRGELHRPEVLRAQLARMLADAKSAAFTDNFAGQWLYLRNLKNMVPLSTQFVDFDDNLRRSFQTEAELFFNNVLHEDRSVLDLMQADYTFVNERLARHYGIPNVYGDHFRRIVLTDDARRGILGKGAVLMVTSHTDRTSPVVRGKWVLENLLGVPTPPMPANVPPLDDSASTPGKVLTMRDRMTAHRANPVCANCHKIMDPIGLAMENFDAVGAWRTREGGTLGSPIDASGVLLDGTKIDGVVSLRQAIMKQPDVFVQTLVEKLMIYALGRGLQAYDMPSVRAITRSAASHEYRFSAILEEVVTSTPFLMRAASVDEN
jgi:hypothetical protein